MNRPYVRERGPAVAGHAPHTATSCLEVRRAADASPGRGSWRGLVVVLSSQASALLGNRMLLLVAIPWLVLASTGSPATAGLVTLCHALPYVIVKVFVGPLIDRLGPRRICLTGDAVSATAMVLLAVSQTPPLWLIMACMACVGAADGPAAAAKTALLPQVIEDARTSYERGTSLATIIERAASAGPLLCGVVIAAYGARSLWVIAVLFAAASMISAVNHRALHHIRPAPAAGRGNYLRQLRDGTRFLHRDRSLRAITIMYVITNFLDQALLGILVPVWAQAHGYSATLLGLTSGVFAGCAVIAAAFTAWLGVRLPRRAVYLIAMITAGVSRFVVLALDAPPAAVLAVFAVAGLGSGAACPIVQAVELERIPPHLRGRVQTLIAAWAWAGIPFGGLAGAGLLTLGQPAALWICGIAYLAAVIYPGKRVTWQPTAPDPLMSSPALAGEPDGEQVHHADPEQAGRAGYARVAGNLARAPQRARSWQPAQANTIAGSTAPATPTPTGPLPTLSAPTYRPPA